jgi:uncharacterized protein (TIGR04255 family)
MAYKKDSIQEALCEINFVAGADPWDLTSFGRLFELVREGYPKRKNQENVQVSFELGPSGPKQTVTKSPKMIFLTDDERALIQLSENQIVTNVLRPYPHWGAFKSRILAALDCYQKAVSPVAAESVVLRYLDHWEFPETGFPLSKYYNFGEQNIYLPVCFAEKVSPCMLRFQCEAQAELVLDLSFNLLLQEKRTVVNLDSRLIKTSPPVDRVAFEDLLETMHNLLKDVYESVINPQLRDLMVPV